MPPEPKTPGVVARYPSATTDELIEKHAQDVSEEGMLLRAACALPIGKLVEFEIQLSDEHVVLTGAGRIVWKRDAPDGERPAGVGVKFVDLDDASQALVDRLVAARKATPSEFERPPPAPGAEPARTVLGMGSPFGPGEAPALGSVGPASPPSADQSRGGTQLGFSAVKLSPAEAARAGTRLGLAPPVLAAGLVLGEQSSPAHKVLPPVRAEATSDIDKAWTDEAKTGKREAAPAPAPAPVAETPLAPAAPAPIEEVEEPEPAPAAAAAPARAPEAEAEAEAPARAPRRRVWPWVVLLLAVTIFALDLFRTPLHDAGLIPDLPWLPSLFSTDETPPPATTATTEPPPQAPPATATPPPPSAVPVAVASAPPVPPSAPSPATAVSAAPTAAPAAAPTSAQDAGKNLAAAKPAASGKAAHLAPSASASAKPRPPPKPKPADDNPY